MELNKIHHLDNREGLALLPEKCANLIISDPPYYEVKGEFDFVWKSFDEYLQFMEHQAQLYKRILADNGTLFVYGHAKRIAYVQVIFDNYFNLENNIVWHKYDAQTNKGVDEYNSFAPVTERILMYSSKELYTKVRGILKSKRKANGLTIKQVAQQMGVYQALYGFYEQDNTGSQIPTKDQWDKIRAILNIDIEHEYISRWFDNSLALTDVWRFSQEAHITGKYNHDTKKPETLTRALILTCSRPGDLVVVPFAGSGTECAMSAKEGRKFIGFDNNHKYVEMGNKRVLTHLQAPDLFRRAS